VQRCDVGKTLERLWDIREKPPCGGLRKVVVELGKEWVQKGILDGCALSGLEGALDDSPPPRAIIVGRGGLVRVECSEVVLPGLPKSSVEHIRIATESMLSGDASIGSPNRLSQMKERACGVKEQALERHGSVPGLGGHAAGALTAFARVIRRGFWLGRDVSRDLVFVLAFFAERASDIVIAADHPGFGVAGSEESERDKCDEPFHNGRVSVWRVTAVVVKTNPLVERI